MTLPSFILGAILASILGTAFHLWRGGSGTRLLFYLVLAWIGFWGGHWIAGQLGWNLLAIGPLNLAFAILGSWLVLNLGHWLSLMQTK
jgi:hypothetical protein